LTPAGHIAISGKKRVSHHDCGWPFCRAAFKNKAPLAAEPYSRKVATIARYQWPKNNHNKMITGIGTPNSQSKIPFPIIASLKFS
jgi:hypothetical protein